MVSKIIKGIGLGILFIAGFFAMVWVFQLLWNVTIPSVFGLHQITYWQALGLLGISRMLFGGYGFRWSNAEKGKFWRERMKMKMSNMTDEEKAEFKRKLWQKCNN
jgi:hypothetical protein